MNKLRNNIPFQISSDEIFCVASVPCHNLDQTTCTQNIETEITPSFDNVFDLMQQDNKEQDQYFYHADHLGSSSWITDASGNVNQHLAYMPYGEQFIDERKADNSRDIRFKFTGKERDLETGLDYFGARYYSSGLSVWLSLDALAGKYPSTSAFMYVRGNPVMLVDPDGRSDHEWNYNIVTGEMTWVSDLGGKEVQFVNFVNPDKDGGMTGIGTAVIEGSKVYAGPVRGGYAASNVNLWSEMPENYNTNSTDYLRGGNYKYSILDLKKRYEVFNNPELIDYKRIIESWESSGNAQPIHGVEFRQQYAAKWKTNKSLWFAIEAGYWNPTDIGAMLDDGLGYLRNFRQVKRVFRYPQIYSSSLPDIDNNLWNQFLKETKGTYSGKDWLRKASNDYKLWKLVKGL